MMVGGSVAVMTGSYATLVKAAEKGGQPKTFLPDVQSLCIRRCSERVVVCRQNQCCGGRVCTAFDSNTAPKRACFLNCQNNNSACFESCRVAPTPAPR
jgi:hypothetical protein